MAAAEMLAGAAPEQTPDWHSIDWRNVWRTVRRLQARIVKAVAEGRWNKVKALVYLLTHSYSGRALAILRVVSNSGRRRPVWTESSGTHRKPSPPLSAPCVGTVINRNRSAGCTFPRATANGVAWAFPRWPIEPCKHYTCWDSTPSSRPWPTAIPMAFGWSAAVPMLWHKPMAC